MHLLVLSQVSVNHTVIRSLERNALKSVKEFSYGISSLNINSSAVQSLISCVHTVIRKHQKFMFPGNQTLDKLNLDGI